MSIHPLAINMDASLQRILSLDLMEEGRQKERDLYNWINIRRELKRKQMDTIGDLIDKLTIVNAKIFKLEDVKREPGATDKTISDATRSTNTLNQQRSQLKNEINAFFGQQTELKSYGKTV